MTSSIIQQAIVGRQMLQFTYSGKTRVVEPHVLGETGGKQQMLTYQTGGESSSGGLPQWRRFDLSGVSALQLTGQSFAGPRPTPTGKHAEFDRIIAVVP